MNDKKPKILRGPLHKIEQPKNTFYPLDIFFKKNEEVGFRSLI
jgi:hypothetical protein